VVAFGCNALNRRAYEMVNPAGRRPDFRE